VWERLGDEDAGVAFRAIREVVAKPDVFVPVLRQKLKAVPAVDAHWVKDRIRALDSSEFGTRRAAFAELEKVAEAAKSVFLQTLEGDISLEVRRRVGDILEKTKGPPDRATSRALRAIEALEHAGTPEAGRVLEGLSKGAPESRVTREASAALRRLRDDTGPGR
jgi:hypothetical protein